MEELVSSPLGFSQRRACALLDQPRSTQRYARKDRPPEREHILSRMRELVAKYPRFGYRRVAALLRQEGFQGNPKRIHRLWIQEGYRVSVRVVRKRRRGPQAG